MKYAIVIPARYNSTRFPGKPLIDIKGKTMIQRVYEKCLLSVNSELIYVATDDKRIEKECKKRGINCIITSKKCLTGTDRVAEVSKKIKRDFYINVQGDEPLCNPLDIIKIINYAKKNPNEIINGYTSIINKKNFYSPNIPKLIFDKNEYLIYMSRAPIPSNKKNLFIRSWRQVCIYSFPHNSLKSFFSKRKTPLESIEDLEILRFLELGYKVKMLKMTNTSISVDTKDDLKLVRKLFKSYN